MLRNFMWLMIKYKTSYFIENRSIIQVIEVNFFNQFVFLIYIIFIITRLSWLKDSYFMHKEWEIYIIHKIYWWFVHVFGGVVCDWNAWMK